MIANLKTSLIILVTAETACILAAETIDLIFYKHSMFLSIPLALLAETLAVFRSKTPNQQVAISYYIEISEYTL